MNPKLAAVFLASCILAVSEAQNLLENILQKGLINAIDEKLRTEVPHDNAVYDFIIVGAGAAGCTLANRLSENPNWTVYLLEAGGVENTLHQVPALASFWPLTYSNWGYKSVPQKRACYGMRNRQCPQPRGKILGGSSSINFMLYNRGNRYDFDSWAAAGNTGWSYNEILPYFLKSERANLMGLENSPYHNTTGPLSVEDVRFRTQMVHAFVEGAQQAGHPYNDYNGESQIGVSYVQATTLNGKRHSAYRAFIQPIRDLRSNLHILTDARVTRVLLEPNSKTAYGVEFLYGKKYYTIRTRKEVILSAGTFNSPQLLMLSGIGPADNLNAIDVPVIQELPVGMRMYEHMAHAALTFITNTTGQTPYVDLLTISDINQYLSGNPSTPLSLIGGIEALGFLKVPQSTLPAYVPDIELLMVPLSFSVDGGYGFKEAANVRDDIYDKLYRPLAETRKDHMTILPVQFHPKSIGRLWLRDRNPLHWPVIDPNYFDVEEDIEYFLEGIKAAIRISQTPAMQRIGATLYDIPLPGCEEFIFGTDDYWRCSIRTLSFTIHHQVATCRMGPKIDPTAVVDPQLKVHGLRKLRVVDTSIIPTPPTAHTNAAAFMIGEKAADMIRGEWI